MGRGNWGSFGRTYSVGRIAGSPGARGSWGYVMTGQRVQRGKDGSGATYNVFSRIGPSNYGGGYGGTSRSASTTTSTGGGGGTTPPANPPTNPGDNDNNQGLDRLGRSGLEIPKTRESRARRRASTRGRRAQGTRRSLRISQSIGSQGSRSGVNTGD